jgi:hypothetical protein
LNIGATVGRPNDAEGQRLTLTKMISLLANADQFGAVDKEAKTEQAG